MTQIKIKQTKSILVLYIFPQENKIIHIGEKALGNKFKTFTKQFLCEKQQFKIVSWYNPCMAITQEITFINILIAYGMLYIAYQQWQTNEKPINQNLFDKRYEFLKNIQDFHMKGGYRNFNPDRDIPNELHMKYLYNLDMGRFLIKEADYDKIYEIEKAMGDAEMQGCDKNVTIKYLRNIKDIMRPYLQKITRQEKYFPTYTKSLQKLSTMLSKSIMH